LQLRDAAVKKRADEKRRAERKQRHLQDDLRYALKKLPDPLDISLSYEAVCYIYSCQFVMLIYIGCAFH
jgi:pre-mRNA-processing factor 40